MKKVQFTHNLKVIYFWMTDDDSLFGFVISFFSSARWNHIVDLDSFFRRIYRYHQKNGFRVIALQELFELIKFVLVVFFIIFSSHCIDYPVLFK